MQCSWMIGRKMSVFQKVETSIGAYSNGYYAVTVTWEFIPNVTYNAVQIYRSNPNDVTGILLNTFFDAKSGEVALAVADINQLAIVARDHVNGILQDPTHHPDGTPRPIENVDFIENFVVNLPALAPGPTRNTHIPGTPEFTSLTVVDGGLEVRWKKTGTQDVDQFIVAVVENGIHLRPRSFAGNVRSAIISPTKANAVYDIGLRADNDYYSIDFFLGERTASSPWVWRQIRVPENLAWPPSGVWQKSEFTDHTNEAAVRADLAVVSRSPERMDLFWVHDIYPGLPATIIHAAYDGRNWSKGQLKSAASRAACMTVMSRAPDTMELFYAGFANSIETNYYYDEGGWYQGQIAPPNSISPDAQMASVSRAPHTMEFWWITPEGAVHGAYWYDNDRAWHRYELAPAGSASREGGLCAVSRRPDHLEVFWAAPGGAVRHAYWYEGQPSWILGQLTAPGSIISRGRLAVVSRQSNTMEVFWIGPNGSVRHGWWYEGGDWGYGEIAPPGSGFHAISACSRRPDHMEIFWTTPLGQVWHGWWYEGGDWGRELLRSHGTFFPTGNTIASVSRHANTMEMWHVANSGTIHCNYIYFK
jgi:hypothetical protein